MGRVWAALSCPVGHCSLCMHVLGREGWEGMKVGMREGIAEPKVMSTHSSIFSLSDIFLGHGVQRTCLSPQSGTLFCPRLLSLPLRRRWGWTAGHPTTGLVGGGASPAKPPEQAMTFTCAFFTNCIKSPWLVLFVALLPFAFLWILSLLQAPAPNLPFTSQLFEQELMELKHLKPFESASKVSWDVI